MQDPSGGNPSSVFRKLNKTGGVVFMCFAAGLIVSALHPYIWPAVPSHLLEPFIRLFVFTKPRRLNSFRSHFPQDVRHVPLSFHIARHATLAQSVSRSSTEPLTLVADLWPNTRNSPMAFCRRSRKGIIDVFCPATTNMTASVINVGSTPITRAWGIQALSVEEGKSYLRTP